MAVRKKSMGFTLIELMITVAIVGILASVAFPAYQNYTTRAQISASLLMVEGGKTFFIAHYAQKGSFPTSNAVCACATNELVSVAFIVSTPVACLTMSFSTVLI